MNSKCVMPNQNTAQTTVSPWLVGLLPWVIDLLFKTSFLNSFLGALLWGLILVVYFAQAKLIDATLKRYLNILLFLLCSLWLGGWLRSFSKPIENPLHPSDSLYFLHATFLVAATGMLFLVLLASGAGLYKEKQINDPDTKQSPGRRAPSLEGLIKLCSWSFDLSKIFWILGCGLAILALLLQASQDKSSWTEGLLRWFKDPAIWAVWFLAIMLLSSKFFLGSSSKVKNLFKSYLFLSSFALLIALGVMWIESRQAGHIREGYIH